MANGAIQLRRQMDAMREWLRNKRASNRSQ